MSKSTVLTLVSTLGLGQDNSTETGIIYDEIVRELGFLDVLASVEEISITPGTATYNVAANTIRSLEFHSGSGFLTKSDGKGLGSLFGADWRNRVGSPLAVSMDQEDDDEFRLVPSPDSSDTLTIIRTEYREDVPFWLELPIVFEILNREFRRESDHQDITFAESCEAVSNLLFNLVGVVKNGKRV